MNETTFFKFKREKPKSAPILPVEDIQDHYRRLLEKQAEQAISIEEVPLEKQAHRSYLVHTYDLYSEVIEGIEKLLQEQRLDDPQSAKHAKLAIDMRTELNKMYQRLNDVSAYLWNYLAEDENSVPQRVAEQVRANKSILSAWQKNAEKLNALEKQQQTRKIRLGGIAIAGGAALGFGNSLWQNNVGDIERLPGIIDSLFRSDPLTADSELADIKRVFKEQYGITLETGISFRSLDTNARSPDIEKLRTALKVVLEEIQKYPLSLFKGSHSPLKNLRLVSELSIKNVVSFGNNKERAPAAGVSQGTVLGITLNVNRTKEQIERTFHHEVFHEIEKLLIKKIPAKYTTLVQKWSAATALTGFSYIYGTTPPDDEDYRDPRMHILSDYGRNTPKEDRAVFAEFMFSHEKHRKLLEGVNISLHDIESPPPYDLQTRNEQKALVRKYKIMHAMYEAVCPEMNQDFWNDFFKKGEATKKSKS